MRFWKIGQTNKKRTCVVSSTPNEGRCRLPKSVCTKFDLCKAARSWNTDTQKKIVLKNFCTYLKLQDVSLQRFSLFLSRSLCAAGYVGDVDVGSDRRDLSPRVCIYDPATYLASDLLFFYIYIFVGSKVKTYDKSRGSFLSTQTAATAAAEGTKFH